MNLVPFLHVGVAFEVHAAVRSENLFGFGLTKSALLWFSREQTVYAVRENLALGVPGRNPPTRLGLDCNRILRGQLLPHGRATKADIIAGNNPQSTFSSRFTVSPAFITSQCTGTPSSWQHKAKFFIPTSMPIIFIFFFLILFLSENNLPGQNG